MTANQPEREALDALAYAHGMELRIDHDPDAPSPFAVWGWAPDYEVEEDADIIGTGETESEAVEAARRQMRIWEHNQREEWTKP